jgi:hypothetical protein
VDGVPADSYSRQFSRLNKLPESGSHCCVFMLTYFVALLNLQVMD